MSTLEQLQVLSRMDRLIRNRATGSPGHFARILGVSPRTLYNYILLIREMGAPVYYSKTIGSYAYTKNGSLIIGFFKTEPEFVF